MKLMSVLAGCTLRCSKFLARPRLLRNVNVVGKWPTAAGKSSFAALALSRMLEY